jgi:hypothetical protein
VHRCQWPVTRYKRCGEKQDPLGKLGRRMKNGRQNEVEKMQRPRTARRAEWKVRMMRR